MQATTRLQKNLPIVSALEIGIALTDLYLDFKVKVFSYRKYHILSYMASDGNSSEIITYKMSEKLREIM